MTVTIQLEAPGMTALQKEAAELGLSVEQLTNEIIRRYLRDSASTASDTDTAFRRALDESVTENDELLRRLAR